MAVSVITYVPSTIVPPSGVGGSVAIVWTGTAAAVLARVVQTTAASISASSMAASAGESTPVSCPVLASLPRAESACPASPDVSDGLLLQPAAPSSAGQERTRESL